MAEPDLPPASSQDGGPSQMTVIRPVVCLACGCLCDDLAVSMQGETVVAVENGCDAADTWFRGVAAGESGVPVAMVDECPATFEEAASRAGELLAEALAPVILGLGGSTNQTVAAAARLADRIGAVLDPWSGPLPAARASALARTGRVSATLGEVKNRADVVVFWGADPVQTHSRHWERYSVAPRGRFIPEGRAGRTVLVADERKTLTAEQADHFVPIDRAREFEILWTLRGVIRGIALNADRVRNATGMELEALAEIAGVLRKARYGALFYSPPRDWPSLSGVGAVFEAAHGLVRELNRHTRFVILGMGEPGNLPGAEAVLAWQTGFPGAIDFAEGHPASLPRVTTAVDLLKRFEADVALVVGGSSLGSPSAVPSGIPVISIGRADSDEQASANVLVRCHAAVTGLEEAGTALRADGVALPLRAVRRSRFPSEREWLEAIHQSVKSRLNS
ncbi:MAG: formylmethanofuran dehydrogenase subunit B [Isosphaeraceae bacterium]